jgi:indole-3-glycerol phosphate synthase
VNTLERIVAETRAGVERRRGPLTLPPAPASGALPFADALRGPGLSLIAEHKRRSPSAGVIRADASLEEVVGAYERGGAAALSVLTEEANFGGSVDDLRRARATSDLALLRKDFIVDPFQVDESAAIGADAILLIVAALGDAELRELHARGSERGLSALVEVHDHRELDVALASGASIVGVNNRDLRTLEVDSDRTFQLLPEVPHGVITVAESGFNAPEQLVALRDAGADAVLVGEALMRAQDIERATRDLIRGSSAGPPGPRS